MCGIVFRRFLTSVFLCWATTNQFALAQVWENEHEDRLGPVEDVKAILSPDAAESKKAPSQFFGSTTVENAFGNTASSAQQTPGALTGKIVFMNSGHGWTFDPTSWRLQRGVGNEMNEDYGNLDQLNFFAAYCFNAGATVVSMRPLGHQTNEVILDNDDAAVTFAGTWSNSGSTIFWGSPGDVPYRFASITNTETATATYTPNIPSAGYYPVYCWTLSGSDRGNQLYRIRHTGGESQVRIPHHMVGNGWIYLGEYYFNAGSNPAVGSVIISNLRGTPTGTVVIADAIRFGNGMGTVDQGGGVSGYPREDESMRYWVKANLAQGQSTSLYESTGNDEQDSWSAPPKMSAEMNRETAGGFHDRIHISFHSNCCGGRGAIGLITGSPTPGQALLADIGGAEINTDLRAVGSPPLEIPWSTRTTYTYTGSYGEITTGNFNNEMDATIYEVGFHDGIEDAMLMRDPKVRSAIGKAAMHAVIKFLNQVDTNSPPPLVFLPEAPTNLRAIAGTNGQISLAWTAPVALSGSGAPTNYIIYRSTNGYGFGNPLSVGNVTSFIHTNLVADTDYYFRVTAANAGGESMPSEVVGCRASSTNGGPRVLVVNGFDRFDRTINLRHNVTAQNWDPPGNSGTIERVFSRWANGFDYIVQHGKSIAATGRAFDSCQNEAVVNNQVILTNYAIVIWACGNETVAGETISSAEQTKITSFLAGSGNLFVSGSDVASDLDGVSGPTTADRNFLHNQLHTAFTSDNSASYTGTAIGGGIFNGRSSVTVDNGSRGIYWVQTPDVVTPFGGGTIPAMNYSGVATGNAAIQYDGSSGGGRVVLFGFPFETISDPTRRNQYMSDTLAFLSAPLATNVPAQILTSPQSQFVVQGSNATLSVVSSGTSPLIYQWRFNGANLAGATQSTLARNNAQPANSGNYQVVVSNAFGVSTSAIALLQIMLPPSLQTAFTDTFDSNTASNWVTNRSSTDTRVTFNYDYAADGISSAPNSTVGTTRGVKFEANMTLGAAAAINISPAGQNFTGDLRLRFDLWMNANGPFPLGGTGSTEHGTAGVGTAGNRVQWTGASTTADGHWFAVDGEGQASDTSTTALNDFGAFSGTTYHAAASGIYAAGTASNSRGNAHSYYATVFPGGQSAPASQQSANAQQTGTLAVGTVGFGWRNVLITKIGSNVEWFLDGLKIATIDNASFTANNIFIGYWDAFASISDNANLSFGLFDNVRVERFVTNVPPYLTVQPVSRTLKAGTNVTFSATAGGTATLGYQWRLNGGDISGATGSVYTRFNLTTNDAGDYLVVVTNASGSVTSANAFLSVTPQIPPQFNSTTVQNGNQLKLTLTGEPGQTITILKSDDLAAWQVVTNISNPTGVIEFIADISNNVPQQFYRAQLGP